MIEDKTAGPSEAPCGVFITFEGGDGAGKTTHINFLAGVLRERGREVLCLREPGGTRIGESLRAVLLDPANVELCDRAELLLYEAARAQIVDEVVAPALDRGAVVLCDRFFDSTVAYQAYGRGLDAAFVERANAFACQGTVPDRTILLVPGDSAGEGLARAVRRGAADRLEQAGEEFHARVRAGFEELAARCPQRVRTVRSSGRKSATARAVFAQLEDLFPWMADPQACPDALFDRLDAHRAQLGRIGSRADAPASAPASRAEGEGEG